MPAIGASKVGGDKNVIQRITNENKPFRISLNLIFVLKTHD